MINHKLFKGQFRYHPLHQSRKGRHLFWINSTSDAMRPRLALGSVWAVKTAADSQTTYKAQASQA